MFGKQHAKAQIAHDHAAGDAQAGNGNAEEGHDQAARDQEGREDEEHVDASAPHLFGALVLVSSAVMVTHHADRGQVD